ncbi:hypothetical protein MNB_SM-7-1145 [hydrothermal vent metagenome]|uniref:Uncharacterized protein n=1 Tax=hydrothermal vent metagenome TaxID=652676 RepID=A0A1W1BAQ2_9ZZZZ
MKRVLFLLFFNIALFAKTPVEFDYELDAYYSNVSAFLNLQKDDNITDGTHLSEYQIYKGLLQNSLSPNIFLLEASLHPMALGGIYFRKNDPYGYKKSSIRDFNIIKGMTSGWEEPYSISFFLGRMMVFKREDASHIGKNRAYSGLLLTYGDKSIKDNIEHKDDWVNIEIKLKGTRELKDKDLDWSFRLGYRHHTNQNFVDTLYLGARRSSVDFCKPKLSLIYNSAFEALLEVAKNDFKVTKGEFIIEKKWPSKFFINITYGLGIGYLYYGGNRYRDDLKDEGVDNHQLIIRPNIRW